MKDENKEPGKFAVTITGVLVWGGIGAIFGSGWMILGVIVGFVGGLNYDPDDHKKKNTGTTIRKILCKLIWLVCAVVFFAVIALAIFFAATKSDVSRRSATTPESRTQTKAECFREAERMMEYAKIHNRGFYEGDLVDQAIWKRQDCEKM